MSSELEYDTKLYSHLFEMSSELIGQTLVKAIFYLEPTDENFTEQPNGFGKSLLNGIDIQTDRRTYSIGNRFTDIQYGLIIDIGNTVDLEWFQEEKQAREYRTAATGAKITEVNVYWLRIPSEGQYGFYPQEIEFVTPRGTLLLSSIEVNNGEVNTEFTNELLVIDKSEVAKDLGLGRYGQTENDRLLFRSVDELIEKLKTDYNNR